MELFNTQNTAGYTTEELAALNAEWAAIVEAEQLEPYTDEYNHRAGWFADEVAGR